jgi:phospholipid/cholesterol/gamma-HCH transport system permease protein
VRLAFNPVFIALDWVGYMVQLLVRTLGYVLKGRFSLPQAYQKLVAVGYDGLPVAMVIAFVAGAVLALQTADKFARTGAEGYVGGLVAIAVCREMAPIFTCLAFSAQSGTAIAAELAHLRITHQTDAMTVLRVDPIRYLVAPRLMACMVAMPLVTMVNNIVAVLGGMVVVRFSVHLHPVKYIESIWLMLKPFDIVGGSVKAMVFGIIMAIISCGLGLRASGGASAVGRTATLTAVWCAVAIMLADFVLTWLLFINNQQQVFRS